MNIEDISDIIIKAGTILTLLGVAGLLACVLIGLRLRKLGLPDAEIKLRLQRLVALNLGALALSGLGLAVVVLGVIIG